jgi:nicotinamide mononucleotide transporter
MKLLFTLLLSGIAQLSIATTYYISPHGNDNNGNGSIVSPWRSLSKATTTVTKAGDIIHVNAGTYIETNSSYLAPQVSIEGDGPASIIQSTLIQLFTPIISARSAEATDGNQHISNIKLDGNNRTTSWGIEIRGRKNVSIHDCIIADFDETGIFWGGRNDNEAMPPTNYATGNSFYNNTVSNCAKYDGFGRGCLAIGGQEGMLIYNNHISQTGRRIGTNGWPIKYANDGYLKGVKIYGNTILKEAFDGITWDFALELFNVSGLEIYNNNITGAIDLNHQNKDNYSYSVYIHDNILGPTKMQANLENGIILEFSTETAIIEKNTFKNLGVAIYFAPRGGSIISDIAIKNNTCDNIGVADKSHQGFAIRFGSVEKGAYAIQNFLVVDNKFFASTKEKPYWGIGILDVAKANNIIIRNNTIKNFSAAGITADPGGEIDTMIIENNILSGNGFANKPLFVSGGPQNYSYKNNEASNGSIFSLSNLKMDIIRPLYYSAKNSSMLELLVLLASIISLWFSRKENIYVFPMSIIASVIYITSNILDDWFPGNACLGLYFFIMSIYGWRVWAKRDMRRHRVIRITDSSKKEKQIQLIVFTSFFILLFPVLQYFKKSFTPGIIPWADALVYAAAFTGMWLMTRKKLESWYWWIAAIAVSIPLYFSKHYLLISIYFVPALALSYWALRRWRRKRIVKKKKIYSRP